MALAATRKRREAERAENLLIAQRGIEEWATVRTRDPWKQWVSAQTKITPKWLTRAVNRGELRPPIKD